MRLSQSHTTVDKERVIRLSRLLGYRHASRMGELIPSANDKTPECIFWVQLNSPSSLRLRCAPSRPICTWLEFSLHRSSLLTDRKCHGHHVSTTSCGHGFCEKGSIMSIQPFPKEFIRNSNVRRRVFN